MKSTNDSRLYPLILLLFIFFQFSCSNEDGIVGKWQLESIDTICDTANPDFTIEFLDSEDSDCIIQITKETTSATELTRMEEICWSLEFKDDNTGVQFTELPNLKQTKNFVYSLDEANNMVEICVNSDCIVFDYDGSVLSFLAETGNIDPSGCSKTFIFSK